MTPEHWEKMQQIFHLALDQEAETLENFVAGACGADEGLRREVMGMLSAHFRAEDFLRGPAIKPFNRIGQSLGGYQIISQLGVGGMGEVYLAHDTKLRRDVAIKTLPAAFAGNREWLARFEREARMLAAVNHPNIAAIYDLQQAGDERFLVLEYIPGKTLGERLAEGPLPIAEAAPLFRQLAEALGAAHARGIVHRDLKPANLKITPAGTLKVLDFGLAKVIKDAISTLRLGDEYETAISSSAASLTDRGVVMGTVPYMSPEQARGLPVDHRTDWWAYGCVLYESLTGQRPFSGATHADIISAILHREPDWRILPSSLPGGVKSLLKECLRKDLTHRLCDAAQVVGRIGAVKQPQTAKSFGRARRVWELASLRWLAGICFLVAILAATLWWRQTQPEIPKHKYLVVTPALRQSAKPEAGELNAGLVSCLRETLSALPGVEIVPLRETNSLTQEINALARSLGANLVLQIAASVRNGQPTAEFWLTDANGRAIAKSSVSEASILMIHHRILEQVAQALSLNVSPRAITGQGWPKDPEGQSRFSEALGYLERDLDEEYVNKAIRLLTALTANYKDSAPLYAALGRAYVYKYGLYPNEEIWAQNARVHCERAAALLGAVDGDVARTLGRLYARKREFRAALSYLQSALNKQPNDVEALLETAGVYARNRQFAEAEELYKRVITLRQDWWPGHNEIGGFYFDRRRYAEAELHWNQVVRLLPGSDIGFTNLGHLYLIQNSFDAALGKYKQSLSISETPEAYGGLSWHSYLTNRFEDARIYAEKGLKLDEADTTLLDHKGSACRWLPNREAEGRAAFKQAVELKLVELAIDPWDALGWANLAAWQAKLGHAKEAENNLRRALSYDETDPDVMNIAVLIYHLAGRDNEALRWAELAVKTGGQLDELISDPELASLRDQLARIR